MTSIFNDFQPTVYALIAVVVLLLNHPKQRKKWEAQKPSRPTRWTMRIVLSSIAMVVFSFLASVLLTPSMSYALINTLTVTLLFGGYLYKTLNDMRKYL